jgi:hypothetical protein
MTRIARLISLSLTGFVMAACSSTSTLNAAEADTPARACAFVDRINSWSYVDSKTIIVETGPNKRYRVGFANRCFGLDHAIRIRAESPTGGCLREGDRIEIWERDDAAAVPCLVRTIVAEPEEPESKSAGQ